MSLLPLVLVTELRPPGGVAIALNCGSVTSPASTFSGLIRFSSAVEVSYPLVLLFKVLVVSADILSYQFPVAQF